MGDMKVQFRDMERRVETPPVKMDGRLNRLERSLDRWLLKIQILGLVSYSHYSYSTTFSKGIWLKLVGWGFILLVGISPLWLRMVRACTRELAQNWTDQIISLGKRKLPPTLCTYPHFRTYIPHFQPTAVPWPPPCVSVPPSCVYCLLLLLQQGENAEVWRQNKDWSSQQKGQSCFKASQN